MAVMMQALGRMIDSFGLNVEKREWTSQTPDFGESKIKLNFSAQIACAPPLKQVYLIGGSKDKNFN